MSKEKEKCPRCGTERQETGPPIWEDYCPNPDCTYDHERIAELMRGWREQRLATRKTKIRKWLETKAADGTLCVWRTDDDRGLDIEEYEELILSAFAEIER